MLSILLQALTTLPSAQDERAVLRVSPEGPIESLAEAQQQARRALAAGRAVEVQVGEGVYRLDQALVFGPEDGASATAEARGSGERAEVVWRAMGAVQILGSTALGPPETIEGPLVEWALPSGASPPHQFFLNGRRATPARTPNDGWFCLGSPGPDGRSSFVYQGEDLDSCRPGPFTQLLFFHDWSVSMVRVRSIDPSTQSVHLAESVGAYHSFFHMTGFEAHPRYRLHHSAGCLDAPGEWTLRAPAGPERTRIAALLGPEDRNGASLAAHCPRLGRLLEIRGRPDAPVRNLRFIGFTFAETRWEKPEHGFAGIQAGFFDPRPAGPKKYVPPTASVRLEATEGCTFEHCRFERTGGAGLWFGRGSVDGRVEGCVFTDIGGNGLMIGEPSEPEDPSTELTRGILVEDCLFEDCGAVDHGSVGLWIGLAAEVVVRHNELRQLPYTGISLGWIWDPRPSVSRDHRIEANHIHHVMQQLSDGGGVYVLGSQPGTVLARNLIHDVPLNLGRAGSNAFFIDQGGSHLLIEENVCHDIAAGPVRFHLAGPNSLRRNLLVVPEGAAPYSAHACRLEDQHYEEERVCRPGTVELGSYQAEVGPRDR